MRPSITLRAVATWPTSVRVLALGTRCMRSPSEMASAVRTTSRERPETDPDEPEAEEDGDDQGAAGDRALQDQKMPEGALQAGDGIGHHQGAAAVQLEARTRKVRTAAGERGHGEIGAGLRPCGLGVGDEARC